MKATIMLQGMLQMLDFLGEDSQVTIKIKTESGEVQTYPLKSVQAGSEIEGIILSNENTK